MDDLSGAFNDGYKPPPLLSWRWKLLIILWLATCAIALARAQITYTAYQLAGTPTLSPGIAEPGLSDQIIGGGGVINGTLSEASGTNGTLYVGYYWRQDIQAPPQAAIWFNGLSQPATALNLLITNTIDVEFALRIDANGNIIAENRIQISSGPTTVYYLLVPNTNSLQAQLTHVTAEMLFYRNGVVNWETQALAWEATAKRCQANKGVC